MFFVKVKVWPFIDFSSILCRDGVNKIKTEFWCTYFHATYVCLNPDVFSIYIYQKSRSEGSVPNSPHYTPVYPCWAGGVTVYLCSYFAFLQLIE